MDEKTRCGFVGLIGRPNVGKSTLLNHLMGQKVSIVSRKAQTTRKPITAIKIRGVAQIIYLDTPGFHKSSATLLHNYMSYVASQILNSAEVIGFVIEALRWSDEDQWIADKLAKIKQPIILIINKVDRAKPKNRMLPYLQFIQEKLLQEKGMKFAEIVSVSADKDENLDVLEDLIEKYLPFSPFLYGNDQQTLYSNEFIISEVVREKLLGRFHQEIPHHLNVQVEKLIEEKHILHINVLIYIAKTSHKSIIIGDKGSALKMIGQQARIELEKRFNKKVFLQIWVKVLKNWLDNKTILQEFGYTYNNN